MCTCVGRNRYFLHSDGSCKPGYVFYGEADRKQSAENGGFGCQEAVYVRCGMDEMRLNSTRTYAVVDTYNCTAKCGPSGGSPVPDLGRCICQVQVDPVQVCVEDQCLERRLEGRVQLEDGKVVLIMTNADG